MIIAVAGPYSADTEEKKEINLKNLNVVGAKLLELGHVPIIGINAALRVIEQSKTVDKNKGIMDISMAVLNCCEALLIIGESPGTLKEKFYMKNLGRPIFHSINEVMKI